MTPDICNHVNVDRYEIKELFGTVMHVICKDCFEEWVE